MTFSDLSRIVGCVFLLGIVACSSENEKTDAACSMLDTYDVEYIGHAAGRGFLRFKHFPQNENQWLFSIVIPDPSSEKNPPLVSVDGIGACNFGVFEGQFSSGKTNRSHIQMVGGSLIGVFPEAGSISPFGRWVILLHDSEKNKRYEFGGYWDTSRRLFK